MRFSVAGRLLVAILLAGVWLATTAGEALAAGTVSLTAIDTTYSENFDTLASAGTSSTTPNGWAFLESGTNANTLYTAGNGSGNSGDTYSFGAALSAERAFGGLQSGSNVPTIGAAFVNDTGETISKLDVSYTGEQWRVGTLGRLDQLDFQISTTATALNTVGGWIDVNPLDFAGPDQAGVVGARDGNGAANRVFVVGSIAISIPPGATFWIRWSDFNASGADDGLAVDGFSLTPRIETALSVSDAAVTEGNSGTSTATVNVTLSRPAPAAVTFDIATADGSATAASGDYVPRAVTGATIPAGGTSYSFDVTVNGDTTFEPDETFSVDVSNVSGATVLDGHGVVTIKTDEAGVVVSEVYGGGGNAGATLTNDFIELYNRTGAAIDLTGWSVQYASAAGSSWQVTPLTGSIPAGRNYLVQEAAGTGGTTPLPSPDATGTIAMGATAGKVALVSNSTALTGACPSGVQIVDFVGYGTTASCFEGSGPTAAPSNTTSVSRKGGGATDTNDNANDFTAGAPDPRPSGDLAPRVASTTPAAGASGVALDSNVTITFSEPVNTAGNWFTIDCASTGAHTASASGGPTTFTLDPTTNFTGNELCTVTVFAANVTDQDTDDPPDTMAANYTFSFQTADVLVCGDPATKIHDVQGSGLSTPMPGAPVTVEGVVVGDYQATSSEFGGFYLQEETADADANAATSEGIFVFDNGFGVDVQPGDVVRARGTATEFFSLTEIGSVNAVRICSSGASVPTTPVSLPVANVNDLESFEGMLVDFTQTLTVTEVFNLGRFGEVSLATGRLFVGTALADPGPAANAVTAQNNRSRIILDDGNNQQNIDPTRYPQGGLSASNTLRVGDSLPGLTGVMDFRFGNYRIQPIGPLSFDHTNPRSATPPAVGGNLKVASFNVLNYFNGNGTGLDGAAGGFPTARGANNLNELNRQRAKEVSALQAMNADIVGLMEMENDASPNSAIEDLVAGLNNAMGAGTYSYIDTGVIGTDQIKVALIYKPASVTPVGTWKIITSAVDPRFIDTRNRPSLAQTFQHNASGGKLTVVVNHLKSKGSSCATDNPLEFNDPDTGDGQGNCNLTRKRAAEALGDWLATDPTGSGDPDFLLIGDMNSYTFEDPIKAFENGGFTNLVRLFGGMAPYSYVFNGESGYLDHVLATASLAAHATDVEDWHINPDEPTVLDYNTEFKTANQINTFYDPGPYRSSDHDPAIAGFHFNLPPTADAGGPYTVAEGGSVTVTASANDPEGGSLTYAWDLDDNGSFETPGQSATFSAASIDGPASRTVKVRVTDDHGSTDVDDATVTIENVAPTATFNAPASSPAGFPFTLSLTNPHDPASADTFEYAFDCGDGLGYGPFTASNSRVCPTTSPGTRSVGGKIRDDDGGFTEYRATVNVTLTSASLCDLVQVLVTQHGIANSLCQKLENAAAAKARGQDKAGDNILDAFINEVEAQAGKKAIAGGDASLLADLARALKQA